MDNIRAKIRKIVESRSEEEKGECVEELARDIDLVLRCPTHKVAVSYCKFCQDVSILRKRVSELLRAKKI